MTERKKENNVKFLNIGFQMFTYIIIFFGIGFFIDKRQNNELKIYTIVLSILGLIFSFFYLYREVTKK